MGRESGLYLDELAEYDYIRLKKIVDKRKDSEGNLEEVIEELVFDRDICFCDTYSGIYEDDGRTFIFPVSSQLFDKAKKIFRMNTGLAWTICSHLATIHD